MEDRMIELEMKMAHFEQTIDELSEVIAHQQTDIDSLRAHIDALLKHAHTMRSYTIIFLC